MNVFPTQRAIARIARALALAAVVAAAGAVLVAARPAVSPGRPQACAECHEAQTGTMAKTPHSSLGAEGCLRCHAGAAAHAEKGGEGPVFAFRAGDGPIAKNKVCLGCHGGSAASFAAGPHGKASLDCAACHAVHAAEPKRALLKATGPAACRECHEDVYASFQLNERHRLKEGILECASCHDPHGPSSRERLGGFKQEACLKCHADKGGPFLYEHGASRIEGCSSCHEPHGSPARHLLTAQSVPDLCFGCHVAAPVWHAGFDAKATNCVACHAAVHGSNLSRIFIK